MLMKILYFLGGFFLLNGLVNVIWLFATPFLGLGAFAALGLYAGISLAVLVVAFFVRKSLALGFFIGFGLNVVRLYMTL